MPTPSGFKLEIKVEKIWKGQVEKRKTASTENEGTCNPFASDVEVGSGCIFFLDNESRVVSGLFGGDASTCVPKNTKKIDTLAAEYEIKFSKLEK